MTELYTKTSSGVERIDVSVPKIEERVTNLENNKLGKTEKAASALVADSASSIEGANVKGTVANATNAVNATNATTATRATSASSVPWTGIANKPNFATVATTGSYNDLADKPSVSSNILTKIFEFNREIKSGNTITITNITPYKLVYISVYSSKFRSLNGIINTGIAMPSSYVNPDYVYAGGTHADIILDIGRDDSGRLNKQSNGYAVVLPSSTSISIIMNAYYADGSYEKYAFPCSVVAYQ